MAHALLELSTGDTAPQQEQPPLTKRRKRKPPPEVSEYMSKIGRKGGKISGKRRMEMSPDERSRIAAVAASARWRKQKLGNS